jgi:hypothetical protein
MHPDRSTHLVELAKVGDLLSTCGEGWRSIVDMWRSMAKVGDLSPHLSFSGYGDKNDFTEGEIFVEYAYDFSHIVSVFQKRSAEAKISPIYLKDPHITWSKKNT